MKKNLTISLNLKEDGEIRKFINEMIVAQVKSISRELIKNVVNEHIKKAIKESIEKEESTLRYYIGRLYESERISRYNQLKDAVNKEAEKVTNEVLINAKETINKALDNVVSDMISKRLKGE